MRRAPSWLLAAIMVAAISACLQLTGCGGGDEDDPLPDTPPPGVNCQLEPERCK